MTRRVLPDPIGQEQFSAFVTDHLSGGPNTPEPAAAESDPRPQRPRGVIDQGARGTSIASPLEAWRQYLSERLR